MEYNNMQSTNRLLKVIIALLARQRSQDTLTLREQVEILNDLGLKPIEIADILGRSNIYVNKELSGIRKSKKRRNEHEKIRK